MNDANNQRWLKNYQIPGVPHVKLFGFGKEAIEVKSWKNGGTAEQIALKVGGALLKLIEKRTKQKKKEPTGPGADGEVVEINESNFKSIVLDSQETWVVLIYEPYCKHCQAFEPEFKSAATSLEG